MAESPGDNLLSAPTDTTPPRARRTPKRLTAPQESPGTRRRPRQKRQSRWTQSRIPSQSKTPSSRSQYCRTSSPIRCSESSPAIRCSSRSERCGPGPARDERKMWCESSCSQHIACPLPTSQRLFELLPKWQKSGGWPPIMGSRPRHIRMRVAAPV